MTVAKRRSKLIDFVKQSGGQKAAAVRLRVSPQFVGQMVHKMRPIPAKLWIRMENLLIERDIDTGVL